MLTYTFCLSITGDFSDSDLDLLRESFSGVRFSHKPLNLSCSPRKEPSEISFHCWKVSAENFDDALQKTVAKVRETIPERIESVDVRFL